jgi:pimeloyl-ACP methyl ester carboxylesterase
LTERRHIRGIELAYEDLGEGADPPLVLLHGFTGHRDDFAEVSRALAAERRVLIPDLRGHGDSGVGVAADQTFDSLVADIAEWLELLGVPICDLLGHSMGGMLALRFVLAHPARVRSLVLMNTAPTAPTGMQPTSLDRAGAIALEHGMDELQQRVERAGRKADDPVIAAWADRYWSHHRRRYLAMDSGTYAGLGRAMAAQEPLTGRLDEIHCPTSVIVGEHDGDFLDGADLLTKGISGARRVTIPDAGHHPQWENREAWLDAMHSHFGAIV